MSNDFKMAPSPEQMSDTGIHRIAEMEQGGEHVLNIPAHVPVAVVARALASFGLRLQATADGRAYIVPAELTRAEAMQLNLRNSRDPMHFTPSTGYCWACGCDLLEIHGIAAIAAGLNVTGCKRCHKTYCD